MLVGIKILCLGFFSDLFGTLDPFGSSSFSSSSNSSSGFADFSHMLKPRDPFEGRASWLPDYQKVPEDKTHPEKTLYWSDRQITQKYPIAEMTGGLKKVLKCTL